MIARILAGSRTTDSVSVIRLCSSTSARTRRVGDHPALEQQITGFFLDEHGRAVAVTSVRVDCE